MLHDEIFFSALQELPRGTCLDMIGTGGGEPLRPNPRFGLQICHDRHLAVFLTTEWKTNSVRWSVNSVGMRQSAGWFSRTQI